MTPQESTSADIEIGGRITGRSAGCSV